MPSRMRWLLVLIAVVLCTAAAVRAEGGESFRTSWDGERFLPFEPRALASDEVARFLKRIAAPELFDSISRPNPTIDPYADLGPLLEFVRGHADETLTVEIVPKGS